MIPGWLDGIEAEVLECLEAHGSLSARELGEHLGISEESALSYIALLARAGRLTVERVAAPDRTGAPDDSMRGSEAA